MYGVIRYGYRANPQTNLWVEQKFSRDSRPRLTWLFDVYNGSLRMAGKFVRVQVEDYLVGIDIHFGCPKRSDQRARQPVSNL